jgi:hypothetical protein
MKWLNRDLPPKILKKLDAKIKRFMSEQTDLDGAGGSLEVKKLCIDLYKVYKDKDDRRTEEELLAMGERWDTDIPELAHIQKYINRLMSDRLQEASDYFEDAAILEESKKEKAASNAKSKNAKESANIRHRPNNRIIAKAMKYYSKNIGDYKNKTQAACDLAIRFPPLKTATYYKKIKELGRC